MDFLIQFINVFFTLLTYAIIARILLSWFRANANGPVARFINDITNPILKPAQRILPPIGMIDFSPILALIALDIIRGLLIRLLIGL